MLTLLVVLSVVLIFDAIRQEKKIDSIKKSNDLSSVKNHVN